MKLKFISSITVYCSSSNEIDKEYLELASNLGSYIASRKIKLVYGGGSSGLMGSIAKSTKLSGGYVLGIIPKFLQTKEILNTNIDKVIVVNNMAERKKLLFDKGDALIALPGGPGTLEEITEVISWFNLGLHHKPIIILNYKKFWQPLINLYENFYKIKFVNKKFQKLFYSVNTISELKNII